MSRVLKSGGIGVLFFSLLFCISVNSLNAQGSQEAAVPHYAVPEHLLTLIESGLEPYVLVDVRTPEEFASGHIPSAVNIPYDIIGTRPPTADKDALIIVYCRSGRRSSSARNTLVSIGYTNVVDFGAVDRYPGTLVK